MARIGEAKRAATQGRPKLLSINDNSLPPEEKHNTQKQLADKLGWSTGKAAQADALAIESAAKHRLADEYDAAQEREEINRHGGNRRSDDFKFGSAKLEIVKPYELHEARQIRDAEVERPGIVRLLRRYLLANLVVPINESFHRHAVTPNRH